MDSRAGIIGVILAGGQARRMGGQNKALIEFRGKPLLAHAMERLGPQVETMILSANGDPSAYTEFGLHVVPDSIEDGGPLAGILAAMEWARAQRPAANWLISVAVDTPLFPTDLVARLCEAVGREQSAVARSDGRLHPTFGLFDLNLIGDLRAYLGSGKRKADRWSGVADAIRADFAADPYDPFINANTLEDLVNLAARSR